MSEQQTQEELDEATKKTRVDSKGKKTKRVKCKPGFKLKSNGLSCVRMTGSEKASRKKAAKKSVKTRKGKSQAGSNRKRAKAVKKRKGLGLS
jgi:hypothetical protein